MYFITFNPELVLVLIRNLTAYVEAAESERYKICSSSADALDPVPSVEEATHIPFVYSAPIIGAASQSGTLSKPTSLNWGRPSVPSTRSSTTCPTDISRSSTSTPTG